MLRAASGVLLAYANADIAYVVYRTPE